MAKIKISPITVVAILSILFIALFLMVSASGFLAIIPGSNLYKNKRDHGYYVFYRLLEELEYEITFEETYSVPEDDKSTIVYIDSLTDEILMEDQLSSWVRSGNTLVVFGNLVEQFLDGESIEYGENEEIIFNNENIDPGDSIFASNYIPIEYLDSRGKQKKVIAENSDGGAIIVELMEGEGSVLIISDLSIFNNMNMHNSQNAVLLNNLFLELIDNPVYLRERVSKALYAPSIVKELLGGKNFLLTLHLIIMLIMFIFITGKRFSKPERLEGKKLRKVTEHIKAVGLFYQKAGAYKLLDQIDSEYFKSVICKDKKPAHMNEQEFLDIISYKEGISNDEIAGRFRKRHSLISYKTNREDS
ncbi:MAG: DUF4350 domain-containing protein [bacterium]|nr:DUF4350 domain-containing protein [bacterium]